MSNEIDLSNTLRYKIRVTTTKDVIVNVPKELTTPESIADWCRGLWHINGVDDIAEFAAKMAANYGSSQHDGIGRIGTDVDARYAPNDRKVDLVYDILDEDDETEIIERPD
ncbi:hypothetical protein [Vogesella oryzae]|uniref:hypothetical protein n=1 Tax=Vogesella oryzae TaxID=1735285 RepID=UPI001581F924|nr:hypothetical protein [Vogesella oryzae]